MAQQYTRGVGVYPGDPKQDFAPVLVNDSTTYRNLALHRPAYHSSAYDYNLTAQLITDGIKDVKLPRWVVTNTSQGGPAKKHERELLLDHNSISTVTLKGDGAWLQFELAGGDAPLEIDRIEVEARGRPVREAGGPGWACIVKGSEDGQAWNELGRAGGEMPPMPAARRIAGEFPRIPVIAASVHFTPTRARFFRLSMTVPGATAVISEVSFYRDGQRVEVGGPYNFTSAWMPEGKGEEWVYVDLGARCTFDRVAIAWIRRAAEGVIQASDDGADWEDIQALAPLTGNTDDFKLAHPVQARYVRLLLKRPATPDGYILSELEVYGTGGAIAPVPHRGTTAGERVQGSGTRQNLDATSWRLQRGSQVNAGGEAISRLGFNDAGWLAATVPATVLSSYWNVGALPDPNYGDNQFMISDSFFYSDFWYRTEFTAPHLSPGQHAWLNFDGVNWKAELFLNGEKIGRIEGAFMRGRFDVSGKLKADNALAVRIEKNATPGSVKQKTLESSGLNGGALGADNPTYHASIGWDWIPTVRGRNIGIWDDVYVTVTGPVTIENPVVRTTLPLPDTSHADVRLELTLVNHEHARVKGTLRARFGDVAFQQAVSLDAGATVKVVADPTNRPRLRLNNPKLWWPAGYGDQNLYDVDLKLDIGGKRSDAKSFHAGVRQFTYSEEGGALKIWINGRRFVGRGGNWGFPETNLRYRAREYDAAVRYHKDMNFTMIRNWVGQTGDEEFYDACDKYGIVVWQDFWLANPADGPDPDDNDLFLRNVNDYLLKIRNHPSVGLYCGRNEGNPPKPIDDGIRGSLVALQPDIHYISNSAFGVVSGGGPYWANPPKFYFQQRATPKLHSELGMPNIVGYDSLRDMMPPASLWPPNPAWGLHDFTLTGAQRLTSFRKMLETSYGPADNAKDWVTLAQFINYDGYRAMFEAQSKHRMGMLLWMSHPCWPSFVWQTYDYYFDPTAGYFGSKKGSEPLHIQWNPVNDMVEVVNYSAGQNAGLTAFVEIINMDGTVKWNKSASLDSAEDSVQAPIKLEFPDGLTPVHFIRLKLERGGQAVSDNFYLRGTEERNFRAIRALPKVNVDAKTKAERHGSAWILTTELQNTSAQPALMVHLKAVREKTGDRILPAIYSDNYIAIMPGELRTIRTELYDADTRGERPAIAVEGFNVNER